MHPPEYRKMAEVEDRMWYYCALHRHVARAIERILPPEATVLDAGCGTGGLLRYLQARQPGWQLRGIDLSPVACQFARERTGAMIAEGSVTHLPWATESFDAIVACDVLCQMEKPAAALAEFTRCLKPGGLAVLTLPAYSWMFSYHDREVANLRRYRRSEAVALLREGGIDPLLGTYWNTLPFPLAVLRRKIFPPSHPTSDVRLYPAPLELMFSAMMALEHGWLSAGGRLPFGSSVLVVGRKSVCT